MNPQAGVVVPTIESDIFNQPAESFTGGEDDLFILSIHVNISVVLGSECTTLTFINCPSAFSSQTTSFSLVLPMIDAKLTDLSAGHGKRLKGKYCGCQRGECKLEERHSDRND